MKDDFEKFLEELELESLEDLTIEDIFGETVEDVEMGTKILKRFLELYQGMIEELENE